MVHFFLLCLPDLFKGLGEAERRGVGVLAALFSQLRCFWYVCHRVERASMHGLFSHSVFLDRGVGIRGLGGFLPSAVALFVYIPANRKSSP